jgi:hypothetical protein
MVTMLHMSAKNSARELIDYTSYGTAEETLELLKPRNKGTRMNCWGALYMQPFHQRNVLIEEQQVSDISSVQAGSHVMWPTIDFITHSDSDQCHTHTLTRVNPTNFDTIFLFWLT